MIFNVQISAPELLPQKDHVSRPFISGLKHGQVLNAKVASVGPENWAQLVVSGQKISAKTDLPLTQGSFISLQVNRGADGVISLRLTPDSLLTQAGNSANTANLGRILQGIDQFFPQLGKTDNSSIKEILHSLALNSGFADKTFLPNLLERIGVSLENKLAGFLSGSLLKGRASSDDFQSFWQAMEKEDLKAAVLSVIGSVGEGREVDMMKGVANTLESFQHLNHQGTDTNRFLLPFPVWAGDGFDFGQLLIDTGGDGKTGEGNRVIQIAFLMNMSALGSIRADFSILNKAITGCFLLEDSETRDYMAALIPELTDRLAAIDYKATRIECRIGAPKDLSSDALVQAPTEPTETSGFNLVI